MSETTTVTVDVDYGQFYLRNVGNLGPAISDSSLAYVFEHTDDLLMLAARQYGAVPVTVSMLGARPAPLDSEWHDVVELSIVATAETALTGWDFDGARFPMSLTPGTAYRLRYAISGADNVDEDNEEITERYRVDLWPQEAVASELIRQKSDWGRYWLISRTLEVARLEIFARGTGTETSRLHEFADVAFATFPELVSDALSDQPVYLPTLASLGYMLADTTGLGAIGAGVDRVAAVIAERARR